MSRLNSAHIVAEARAVQPRATGLEAVLVAIASRLGDYLELTKPRIVVLELIVAGAAARIASPHALHVWTVVQALAATALVAASASMANQDQDFIVFSCRVCGGCDYRITMRISLEQRCVR